jgi:ribosomal protein S18 acetylase RimI-like enzyme
MEVSNFAVSCENATGTIEMNRQLTQGETAAQGDSQAPGPQIADLRHLSAQDLGPLLRDETLEWGLKLDWDFSKSAGLVRDLVDARKLRGVALLDRGQAAAYGYAGLQDHKGLIADVYVRPAWRGGNTEAVMFSVLLDALIGTSGVRRIESQLMLVEAGSAQALQRERRVRLFERLLMRMDANTPLPLGGASTGLRFRIEPWAGDDHDAAATVLSLAYIGHIDSDINDEYRTFTDASRLLHNIVQFPGCAAFYRPASYIAFETATGDPAGILLASFVADDVAHITEICVTPHARGVGLGYELLRRSAATLRDAGAKRISLTVTAANQEAVRLYTRCGFHEIRRFYAYVWERLH